MIIAVAHASKIKVIAEGVERDEQLRFLRDEGCDEIQGFLFSEPVPAEQITRMVRREECVGASLPGPGRPGHRAKRLESVQTGVT